MGAHCSPGMGWSSNIGIEEQKSPYLLQGVSKPQVEA